MVDFTPPSLSDNPTPKTGSATSSPQNARPIESAPADNNFRGGSYRSYNPKGTLIFGIFILAAMLFAMFIFWKILNNDLDPKSLGEGIKLPEKESTVEFARPIY